MGSDVKNTLPFSSILFTNVRLSLRVDTDNILVEVALFVTRPMHDDDDDDASGDIPSGD